MISHKIIDSTVKEDMPVRESHRKRLIEIDRVTALAIFLVVVGHVVARKPPDDNSWYVSLKSIIYMFHMPLFMFISGCIFAYTYKPISTTSEYFTWATKKIHRLAPGFLIFGSLIILGKKAAINCVYVDNPSISFLSDFYYLLIDPIKSPASSLWYIYVLIELYLIFPILIRFITKNLAYTFMFCCTLHLIHLSFPIACYFKINYLFEYAYYFSLGALMCVYYDQFIHKVNKYKLFFIIIFISSFISTSYLAKPLAKTFIGTVSIPAFFGIAGSHFVKYDRILITISSYTYTIYLMNTIAIGTVKGVLLKLFSWDGPNFFLYFIVLIFSGLFFPILAHKIILYRIPYISKITR